MGLNIDTITIYIWRDDLKIRQDFVTNSSSSSYIVALHKDFSEEELNCLIQSNMEIIEKYSGYYGLTKEEAIEEIKDDFGGMPDLTIDDWKFYIGIAGDELDFYGLFMYYIDADDTEHFKMRYAE